MQAGIGLIAHLRYWRVMSDRRMIPTAAGTPAERGVVDRLLFAHPRTVGESYVKHLGIAGRFGATMMAGGVKCLLHAVLPAVFERSASECVTKLNGELTRRRAASADSYPDYVI